MPPLWVVLVGIPIHVTMCLLLSRHIALLGFAVIPIANVVTIWLQFLLLLVYVRLFAPHAAATWPALCALSTWKEAAFGTGSTGDTETEAVGAGVDANGAAPSAVKACCGCMGGRGGRDLDTGNQSITIISKALYGALGGASAFPPTGRQVGVVFAGGHVVQQDVVRLRYELDGVAHGELLVDLSQSLVTIYIF